MDRRSFLSLAVGAPYAAGSNASRLGYSGAALAGEYATGDARVAGGEHGTYRSARGWGSSFGAVYTAGGEVCAGEGRPDTGASADPHDRGTPRPGMICLPGSSKPGKDVPVGLVPNRPDQLWAHELAERGFVCLVLDYPLTHTMEYATDPYAMGYASTTMKGIVNHRRGIDLLQSLPYVAPGRIGVIGHSWVGITHCFRWGLMSRFAYCFHLRLQRFREAPWRRYFGLVATVRE